MRVIAGTARSLPLKTVEGLDTRPTTDRVKETLFNMLNPQLSGCRFLDLFAGSGAIGIEALSRGASHAVFVENSEKAIACIRHNLTFTHLDGQGDVMMGDVLTVIGRLERQEEKPFDVIFMDPPYDRRRVGLNHLAFHAASRQQVDELTEALREKGVPILY